MSHAIGSQAERRFADWLATYKAVHRADLDADSEFARWLEEEYVPLAGSWHY